LNQHTRSSSTFFQPACLGCHCRSKVRQESTPTLISSTQLLSRTKLTRQFIALVLGFVKLFPYHNIW